MPAKKVTKSRRGATAAAKLQVNDPESGVRNRKGACVCVCVVCVTEAAGGGGGRAGGGRDTESKTRTPHKVVGKKLNLVLSPPKKNRKPKVTLVKC